MTAVTVFCLLSVLLFIGKTIRVFVPFLQRCYLPSSVIGGVVGLILFQCFPNLFPADAISAISKLPGFMINVVFATLFLGVVTPPLKKVFQRAFPQLCFGQLLAWGQYVIGFAAVGFLLIPLFGVNEAFGNLLEIGFQGGHGTVSGMAESFRSFGWEDGIALGYTVATAGMVLGVIIGIMLVNWAGRKGYVKNIRSFSEQNKLQQRGIYHQNDRPAAGCQTVYCDSIDSLAWHVSLVGISILVGFGMQKGIQHLEIVLFPDAATRFFSGFPLFPFCMIGGLLLQKTAQKIKVHTLIDHGQMQRLAGASLDFLVLSAMATIKLSVVVQNWQGLLIIIVLGTIFSVSMVVFAAPRIFPESWFECAIADFGQSLGVTATGLMLLRTADPEGKTCATEAFGYKQLLHEPIMGGGLWTAMALTLLFKLGWQKMLCISATALLFWIIIAFILARKNRKNGSFLRKK
ncbi:MAG: sodium:glutamate symporter [Lentisphaeria bacterium]|nr:sodium:glutamate symporter [Lentisphaeria bacterium]